MMVIHINVSSDDAALMAVMAGPTLSAEATTKFGNIEAASSSTSSAAAPDWAMKAPRSQSLLYAKNTDATMATTNTAASNQRTAPSRGSIAG